jgi:hypothetical protein
VVVWGVGDGVIRISGSVPAKVTGIQDAARVQRAFQAQQRPGAFRPADAARGYQAMRVPS